MMQCRWEKAGAEPMNVASPLSSALQSSPTQAGDEAHIRRDERRRIGRELHDSTSQLLVVLQLNLACLKESSEDADTHELFSVLDETLQKLHAEVRAVSSSSEMPSLQESLPAALRAMTTRFALLTHIKVTLDVQGHYVSQADDVEMSLYRIAQE